MDESGFGTGFDLRTRGMCGAVLAHDLRYVQIPCDTWEDAVSVLWWIGTVYAVHHGRLV